MMIQGHELGDISNYLLIQRSVLFRVKFNERFLLNARRNGLCILRSHLSAWFGRADQGTFPNLYKINYSSQSNN